MALFTVPQPPESKPESPKILFRDLNRDPTIKFLYDHQGQLLDQYYSKHLNTKDLAIELPTGAGKTLVALMIAEFRRRSRGERVAFLCPTRQLCAQVHSQAKKYGVDTSLLVGKQANYDAKAFYEYQRAKAVAVTTYSGVFNSNPRINDAELIICDDAHAAENHVADPWTVIISRKEDKEAFEALFRCLEPIIPENLCFQTKNYNEALSGSKLVDLVSPILAEPFFERMKEAIHPFTVKTQQFPKLPEFVYAWRHVSAHLGACLIYCTPDAFEIRPPIPPTMTHSPFAAAKQRIYMSATLSENGDIERAFGIRGIDRLPVPEGWDQRGTGRRLILFPGLLTGTSEIDSSLAVLNSAKRSLVLVSSDTSKGKFAALLPKSSKVFESKDIEISMEPFTSHAGSAVLLIANRYDGIDLPGDDCRVMALQGLPRGSGLQERYLVTRLGATSQFRERFRTRITQAIGRCTRDEGDFSVVLLLGEDVLKWCCTSKNVSSLHPEIQAEIEFGLENSKDRKSTDMLRMVQAFLSRATDWEPAEKFIKQQRTKFKRIQDDIAKTLATSAVFEIDYAYRAWAGQYEDSVALADRVVTALEGGASLKPYRSFWLHQAGVSAYLAWKQTGKEALKRAAMSSLERAAATAPGLPWIPKLYSALGAQVSAKEAQVVPVQDWFAEVSAVLEEWHVSGTRFGRELADVKTNLDQDKDAKNFERALSTLGRMLGAKVHQWTDNGKPDGLWIFGERIAFVFEAKTDEKEEGTISLTTVRQALTHENCVRADKLIAPHVPCVTVVIARRSILDKSAVLHVGDLRYLSHADVLRLFDNTAIALEQMRAVAQNTSDEDLCDYGRAAYVKNRAFVPDVEELFGKRLTDLPT